MALVEGAMWGSGSWGALPGPVTRVRRRAAVLGIVASGQVVVVYFSVLRWRGLHQPPTILTPDQPAPIAGSVLAAPLLSLTSFTLAAGWFAWLCW